MLHYFNPAVAAKRETDPYYNNVVLAIHGNGADGSTSIIDTSISPKVITVNGNAQIDTAQFKFGGSSILFDGSGDGLAIAAHSSFNLMGGDFTIRFWLRANALGDSHLLTLGTGDGTKSYIVIKSSRLRFGTSTANNWTDRITSGTTLVTNQWYHIALTKSGSTFTLWLDGVSQGTSTTTAYITTEAQTCYIGQNWPTGSSSFFNGWIDDIQITKGVARYTSAFTPPTRPFVDVQTGNITPLKTKLKALGLLDNLKLCLDAGSILSSSLSTDQYWRDLSGNGYDFVRGAGSGAGSNDPTFNGTPGNLSSSEYFSFDGGDWLTYDSANETWMQNLHKDNAVWSLACWIYLGSGGTFSSIIGSRIGSPDSGIVVQFTTANTVRVASWNNGAAVNYDSITAVSTGQWIFIGISINEPANTGIFQINEVSETFTPTFVSTNGPGSTLKIGSRGDSSATLTSGSRLSALSMWDTTLSQPQLLSIYHSTRVRYGV